MKIPVTNLLVVTCFFAFASKNLIAQSNISDSAFYSAAVHNTISIYHSTVGDQSALLNGRLNAPYPFPFKEGDPYFETNKFRIGTVTYDSILYENVMLLYDELGELLTTLAPYGRMQFISEKVQAFSISGSQFVRIEKDTLNPMPTGFYQQLYNGKTAILKKNQKSVREVLESAEGVIRFIDEKPNFYLKKGSRFSAVKTKAELFKLMQDHKKEVQQFIKKNGLNVKNDQQNTIVKVAEYYDQITR